MNTKTTTTEKTLKRTKIYQNGNIVVLEFFSPIDGRQCKKEFYERGQSVYDAKTDNQVCYGLATRGDTLMVKGSLLATIRAEWPAHHRCMTKER